MNPTDKLAAVGQDWDFHAEFTSVEILQEKRRSKNDERRFLIASVLIGTISFTVFGLGVYGIISNKLDIATSFWSGAGPIFGTVVGYYFGKSS